MRGLAYIFRRKLLEHKVRIFVDSNQVGGLQFTRVDKPHHRQEVGGTSRGLDHSAFGFCGVQVHVGPFLLLRLLQVQQLDDIGDEVGECFVYLVLREYRGKYNGRTRNSNLDSLVVLLDLFLQGLRAVIDPLHFAPHYPNLIVQQLRPAPNVVCTHAHDLGVQLNVSNSANS